MFDTTNCCARGLSEWVIVCVFYSWLSFLSPPPFREGLNYFHALRSEAVQHLFHDPFPHSLSDEAFPSKEQLLWKLSFIYAVM